MKIELFQENGASIAAVSGEETIIVDASSALDLAMSVKYETGSANIVLAKNLICEEFFILSSGLAGEILQKFINYHFKAAIYGDYTCYTSKPLRDFIYESNRGNHFFFVPTREEAVRKLAQAL